MPTHEKYNAPSGNTHAETTFDQLRAQRAIRAAVRDVVTDLADRIMRESQKMVPVDRGTLKKSANVRVVETKDAIIASVGYNTAYAAVMEYGRRKGAKMPPVSEIRKWVERKGIAPTTESDRAAWAIARSISKNGIKGRAYLRRAVKRVWSEQRRLIPKEIQRALRIRMKTG